LITLARKHYNSIPPKYTIGTLHIIYIHGFNKHEKESGVY